MVPLAELAALLDSLLAIRAAIHGR
jgi:hypothetical protein